MQKEKLNQLLPHVVAIVIFIVLSAIYFFPQLQGLQLNQGDTQRHMAMSKEISDFRDKYHQEPLWTNSMFSGMPAYQISTKQTNYVDSSFNTLIFGFINRPIAYLVLGMIAFYILMISFGANPWISIIGSLAFGFASFNVLYLVGGHNSKVHAVALLPGVIASIMLAYRKNIRLGAILLALFVCLQVAANHLQMTYYALFLIAAVIITEFYIHLKNKLLGKFFKVSLVLLIAGVIGILPTISNLITTNEYGKYSTRGKSELTITPKSGQQTTTSEALESGYITEYNMGYGEVWSLVIPNVKGGAQEAIGNKKDIMAKVDSQDKELVAQSSSYWGDQAGSGGAFYYGATVFLLFVLGMVFIKDKIKWAFFGASLLAIFLSWKNGFFIELFINHFPLFNKFRDTKMILLIIQISFPLIGLLFIQQLLNTEIDKKKLIYTLLAVNGLLFLFYIVPKMWFSFYNSYDLQLFDRYINAYKDNPAAMQQINSWQDALESARILIFKKDVLRSLFFILLTSGLIYSFVIKKIKTNTLLIVLGILILADLWFVDKRYLNNEKTGSHYQYWVSKKDFSHPFRASQADQYILMNELQNKPELKQTIDDAIQAYSKTSNENPEIIKEKISFRELNFATDYRVLTLNNPFADTEVSYFHKSIGGYHGAKLKKYQELIDFYLNDELGSFIKILQDSLASLKIEGALKNDMTLYDMLNTKYIIFRPDAPPIINPYAFGDCWLAKDIKYVDNADAEMLALGNTDLKSTAILNSKYKNEVPDFKADSTASISLVSYKPNLLTYKSNASSPQFAVFSEIYYPKGWDAFIDGKQVPYFNANYLLRAMNIPAGEHTIEFRFEPKSYLVGNKISMASSILLLVILLGAVGFEVFNWIKK